MSTAPADMYPVQQPKDSPSFTLTTHTTELAEKQAASLRKATNIYLTFRSFQHQGPKPSDKFLAYTQIAESTTR